MKLAELKNRFRNRYVIRIAAGVLTVALVGSGVVYAGKTAVADAAQADTEAVSAEVSGAGETSDDGESLNLENMITTGDVQVGKEETVYLISKADGTVSQTIVMEHLLNENGSAVLEDATTLSDIQNVKGNETFTQDGRNLTWQADGNDIYYRGTAQDEAPVTQKVTYYLDGKEIAPEELAGKSGRVTIRFDYENHTTFTEEINGEKIEVKVPFAAVTGLVLDEGFSNIEVTNGKVRQNGDSSIVFGYALPGLAESLKVEESDFSENVELPEYFEVTADVENFSLSTAMTFVVNAADCTDIEGIDTSDLDEKIAELEDASGQLEDGSKELADGLDTLKNSLGDFSDGMKALSSGLTGYTDGTEQLNDGILQVKEGVDLLAGSKDALSSGISQLKDGSSSALEGANALVSGCDSLYSGTKQLTGGASELANGASTLAAGASELASGASEVDTGAAALASGAAELDAGVDLLVDTLGDMSQELADSEAAILAQFRTDAVKGLLAQLDAKYADGVTAENLAEVTKTVAENEGTLTGTLQYMGYDETSAQAVYDDLLSGLYQAQGAISVLHTISEKLGSNASNIAALAAGSESLKQGATQLSQGTSQLSQGASQLSEGATQLSQGAASLSSGAKDLQSGAKQVYDGNQSLAAGLGTLDDGIGSLAGKVPSLMDGITSLQNGVNTLADGSNTLVSNNADLLNGMNQLLNGTGQIVDGVDQLDDGSHQLADGIQQFNEEGISQLVNSYNGDVKSLTNRLQAVLDAGNDYQTYTALADGTSGSVKFIYKLESVKAE